MAHDNRMSGLSGLPLTYKSLDRLTTHLELHPKQLQQQQQWLHQRKGNLGAH